MLHCFKNYVFLQTDFVFDVIFKINGDYFSKISRSVFIMVNHLAGKFRKGVAVPALYAKNSSGHQMKENELGASFGKHG
jgi:hypothetical protein